MKCGFYLLEKAHSAKSICGLSIVPGGLNKKTCVLNTDNLLKETAEILSSCRDHSL